MNKVMKLTLTGLDINDVMEALIETKSNWNVLFVIDKPNKSRTWWPMRHGSFCTIATNRLELGGIRNPMHVSMFMSVRRWDLRQL